VNRIFWSPGGDWLTREAARRACVSDGDKVLDIGCGNGIALRRLSADFGCVGVGVDSEAAYMRSRGAISESEFVWKDRLGNRFLCQDAAAYIRQTESLKGVRLVLCVGGVLTYLGLREYLGVLHAAMDEGAHVALSELVFKDEHSTPPSQIHSYYCRNAAYAHTTNRTRPTHSEMYDLVLSAGFRIGEIRIASDHMWNEYYESFSAASVLAFSEDDRPALERLRLRVIGDCRFWNSWGRAYVDYALVILQKP